MNLISKEHVNSLIEKGYQIKISDSISGGFDFYTKNFGKVLGSTLLAGIIPFLNVITTTNILRAYREIDLKSEKAFDSIFKFDKTGDVLICFLISFLFFIALYIPVFFIMSAIVPDTYNQPENYQDILRLQSSIFGYLIVMIIVVISFSTFLYFTIPLILFGGYDGWDAMKTSFKIVKNNFFKILLIQIIAIFMSTIGFIACYIGVLFTLPIFYCVQYTCTKHLLFSQLDSEIDQLGVQQDV